MATSETPLVSVVIPVYNGQEFIADAIRSVLAQTYGNFKLTIANNCSTDRTVAIADEFARNDPRVTVFNATEFVTVVGSHNRAFSLISDEAEYCLALGADDCLMPNCLEEMVAVGEAYPTVGLITSYFISGSGMRFGPRYPNRFFPGTSVGRHRLLNGPYAFGGPSSSMLRASVVRNKRPFYDPLRYHGDTDAYMTLLKDHDLGFVHQVLSYHRRGDASPTTSYLDRVGAPAAHWIDELMRFGPVYLSKDELKPRLRAAKHEYYTVLARGLFDLEGREFWDFHLRYFAKMGHPVSYGRLAVYALLRVADVALNPLRSISNVFRRIAAYYRDYKNSHKVAPPSQTASAAPKQGPTLMAEVARPETAAIKAVGR